MAPCKERSVGRDEVALVVGRAVFAPGLLLHRQAAVAATLFSAADRSSPC
jgi:hypothetical protein